MDRFIATLSRHFPQCLTFKIQYGQIYSTPQGGCGDSGRYLKSNMDRFIDETRYITATPEDYLKSNMDRFIVTYA